MLEQMETYIQPWRSNVNPGLFYTQSLRSDEIQIYFTYDSEGKSGVLTVIRLLYRDGHLATLAQIHLTDVDLDGLPDVAQYTSQYFSENGVQVSLNPPANAPSKNDLQAWNAWLTQLADYLQQAVDEINRPENVEPE